MNSMVMSIFAGLGAFLVIGLLSFLDSTMNEVVWLMAPFGATAVLIVLVGKGMQMCVAKWEKVRVVRKQSTEIRNA